MRIPSTWGGLAFLLTFLFYVRGDEVLKGVQQNPDGSGTIRFEPPSLDDEEAHSFHMPDTLRCDACRLLAHKFYEKFETAHKNRPDLKRLPESEYLDVAESVCNDKFDNCGLKVVDGKKRLSGPGLETGDVPGIMQGGGKWPYRLKHMCEDYIGELEEEPIYEAYLEHGAKLEEFLCQGQGITGACSQARVKEEL